MGAKITQAQIGPAVAKLALPDFVLKEVKEHQKAFEDAVSSYRRKFLFNRKFQEEPEVLAARLKGFTEVADTALETIYTVYKKYGLDDKSIKAKKNGNIVQAIMTDVGKKLKTLKTTLPGYEFDFKAIDERAAGGWAMDAPIAKSMAKVVPAEEVKACEAAKREFDVAVKKFGSASFLSKKLKKGGDRFEALKIAAAVHIGCIYAAEDYYSSTSGFQSLEKIAVSVRKTIQSIEKDNDDKQLFKESTTQNYLEKVTQQADVKDKEHTKIPAVYFEDPEAGYAADYENLLTTAIKLYEEKYTIISVQKKNKRADKTQNTTFYDAVKDAHEFLKKLKKLKEFERELNQLALENPKYKTALKGAMAKLYNSKLLANIAAATNKFETLVYTAKFGEEAGYEFRNLVNRINKYAEAIQNFILVFSNPKSSLAACLMAITKLKDALKDVTTIKLEASSVKYELEVEEANKVAEELTEFSRNVTKETRKWEKKYEEFQKVLSIYKEETSTTKKVIQVVKILGLVLALAAGAAQISASVNSDGVVIGTAKTTK